MKKVYLLLLVAIVLLNTNLNGQNTAEWFSTPGLVIASYVTWDESIDPYGNTSRALEGDTVLCGRDFLVFHRTGNTEHKRLLRIVEDQVYLHGFNNVCDDGTLLYDFSMEVGDSYWLGMELVEELVVINKGETYLENGEIRPFLELEEPNAAYPRRAYWINGIGDVLNGLFHDLGSGEAKTFVCAKANDEQLWMNAGTEELCDSLTCPAVKAEFAYTSEELAASFTNQSRYADSFHWDFGDGNSSEEANPVHYYTNPGCYTVTLTASSNCTTLSAQTVSEASVCMQEHWQSMDHPMSSVMSIDFVDENLGWAVNAAEVWKTEDAGQSWQAQTYPEASDPEVLNALTMADESRGFILVRAYGSADNAIFHTFDGGDTWFTTLMGQYFWGPSAISTDGLALAVTTSGDAFVSENYGLTWVDLDMTDMPDAVDLQYLNDQLLYGLFRNGSSGSLILGKSTNNGQDWQQLEIPNQSGLPGLVNSFHFVTQDYGFVGGYEGSVLRTTDGGESWTVIPIEAEAVVTDIDFADENHGWATGLNGLMIFTTDGGLTWSPRACGFGDQILRNVEAISPDLALVGGFGFIHQFDHFEAPICEEAASLESVDNAGAELVSVPNPASGSLRIIMESGEEIQSGDVLQVLDINGRIVAELEGQSVNASMDASVLAQGVYTMLLIRDSHTMARGRLLIIH